MEEPADGVVAWIRLSFEDDPFEEGVELVDSLAHLRIERPARIAARPCHDGLRPLFEVGVSFLSYSQYLGNGDHGQPICKIRHQFEILAGDNPADDGVSVRSKTVFKTINFGRQEKRAIHDRTGPCVNWSISS